MVSSGGCVRLSILFWIYKDVDLCINRLRMLRRLNPELSIYCLYGGPLEAAEAFREGLEPWVHDFHVFSEERSPRWKWLQGDQLITNWYRERGVDLPWDTIFIAQWDLLMLSPLQELCAALEPEQLILPGLRCIRDVEHFWWWVRPGSSELEEYQRFSQALASSGLLPEDPLCCNFVAAALPRRFLDRYAAIPDPDGGFLEYKIPMYAQAWGMDFCRSHPFNPVWTGERERGRVTTYLQTMHAEKQPIRRPTLLLNAVSPWGSRVFHPYERPFPMFTNSGPI
jgi:hypothetical protein